ncbi:MAG: hypothetical protein WD066_12235 [Planctomycetaceae bacterium]
MSGGPVDFHPRPKIPAPRPAFETIVLAAGLPAILALSIAAWPARDARMYLFETPHASGVTFDGVNLAALAWLAANYALTAWLGYALVAPFFRGVAVSRPVRLVAAFLPGYLAVIAVARVLALVFGSVLLSGALYAVIAGIVYSRLQASRSGENGDRTLAAGESTGGRRDARTILFLAGSVLFVAAVLMLQIFQNYMFWVGHGTQQYAIHLEKWGGMGLLHSFPIVLQHYDELLYHYAIAWPLIGRFDPILPWWSTLALVKWSAWAAIFASLRALRVAHWPAVAFSTFFLLGTFFPPGLEYYLMFDSANPLAMCAHSGRIAGVVIVLMLVADQCRSDRPGRLDRFALAILALGLTATSLSNSLWLLAITAALTLPLSGAMTPSDRWSRRELFASSACVLAAAAICPLLYALPFDSPFVKLRLALVAAPAGVWGGVLLVEQWRAAHREADWKAALRARFRRLAVPVLAASLVGLVLLGNLYAGGPRNGFSMLMKIVFGAAGLPLGEERLEGEMSAGNWSDLGDHRELDVFPETYALNGPYFVAYYGLLLAMMLAANRRLALRVRAGRRIGRRNRLLHRLFVSAVVSLPVLFFFIDFIGVGQRAGIKLRFLEIPTYLIVFLFCVFASRFARRSRKLIVAAAIAYSIAPFLGTERPRQIQANFELFVELLVQ